MNVAILCGNVGKDPELKETQGGNALCKFSLATHGGAKDKEPDWHNIVAWGRVAETCSLYVKKGDKVLVNGRISQRKWEGDDGKMNYMTEIVAFSVEFMGQKRGDDNDQASRPAPAQPAVKQHAEDLPF